MSMDDPADVNEEQNERLSEIVVPRKIRLSTTSSCSRIIPGYLMKKWDGRGERIWSPQRFAAAPTGRLTDGRNGLFLPIRSAFSGFKSS